jgi:hypothetical protein
MGTTAATSIHNHWTSMKKKEDVEKPPFYARVFGLEGGVFGACGLNGKRF